MFPLNRKLFLLKSVDSTNDFLQRHLKDHPDEKVAAIAQHQSKGKGQANSIWESESCQNVLLSAAYYPEIEAQSAFLLNKIISLTTLSFVRTQLGLKQAKIKWPNDIIVDRKKVAGILVENSLMGNILRQSIVGIGINVNQASFYNVPNATSVFMETGEKRLLLETAIEFLKHLDEGFEDIKLLPSSQIDAIYHRSLLGHKKEESYRSAGKVFTAILEKVDEDGKTHLKTDEGVLKFDQKEVQLIL